ncbi:MAG: endonuclease/exonuclease/phosphatase family protein [Pseudomonadota bacterium]|nr:endonuclease/exonuclease/phosphatase family protein [Pseudomonadota bacterium]
MQEQRTKLAASPSGGSVRARSFPKGFCKRFAKVAGNACMRQTILVAFSAVVLTACITVPQGVRERTSDSGDAVPAPVACHPGTPEHVVTSRTSSVSRTLDPNGFRLLNWNGFKGESHRWLKAFAQYSDGQDLVTLQEAYLTDDLRALLGRRGLQWDLATAFRKQQHAAGVMTLSRITPDQVCVQRTLEPWLLLPKSTLISRFRFEGQERALLVANIHSVNFTLGTAEFRDQLSQLAYLLKHYDGPIILAGDFNTWNDERVEVLEETLIDPLSLEKVHFDPRRLRTVFEHNLDYVFFRGLSVVAHEARETRVSDHNPMWVTFKSVMEKSN